MQVPVPGGSGPAFATEAELLAAHLGPAPIALQEQARQLFLLQAAHFEKVAAIAHAGVDHAAAMRETESRFDHRLRCAAAEKLAAGEGLLLVGGLEHRERIAGKQFLIWGGGSEMFGRRLEVLVVFDTPDVELSNLDAAFRSLRLVGLSERLAIWNAKPPAERQREILEFANHRQESREPARGWFGLDGSEMPFVRVDRGLHVVLPIE